LDECVLEFHQLFSQLRALFDVSPVKEIAYAGRSSKTELPSVVPGHFVFWRSELHRSQKWGTVAVLNTSGVYHDLEQKRLHQLFRNRISQDPRMITIAGYRLQIYSTTLTGPSTVGYSCQKMSALIMICMPFEGLISHNWCIFDVFAGFHRRGCCGVLGMERPIMSAVARDLPMSHEPIDEISL
jgi:hypothetical protein